MSKGQSLQDPFLNALRKDRIPVSIFLVNGIKLQGQIESFDQYVVLLKNTVSQMVYKHAISTVVPTRNPRTDGATPSTGTGYPSSVGVMSGSNYQVQAILMQALTVKALAVGQAQPVLWVALLALRQTKVLVAIKALNVVAIHKEAWALIKALNVRVLKSVALMAKALRKMNVVLTARDLIIKPLTTAPLTAKGLTKPMMMNDVARGN